MAEVARSKRTSRRRYCPGPEKFVELTALVVEEAEKTRVIKWEGCEAQNWCGKKCNMFYDAQTADFISFSDTQLKEL
ncbi:MAG: hypothetical protein RDV48_17885 [Candidatus Eremiobacteraeota bacterium]|nr:hypothetical protein [Candidatus Eremiobacteraeota bacterium]